MIEYYKNIFDYINNPVIQNYNKLQQYMTQQLSLDNNYTIFVNKIIGIISSTDQTIQSNVIKFRKLMLNVLNSIITTSDKTKNLLNILLTKSGYKDKPEYVPYLLKYLKNKIKKYKQKYLRIKY